MPVDMDERGIVPAALDAALSARAAAGLRPAKLLYTIPTGQNPTGAVMDAERMAQVYELARKWDLVVIEDDAYYWLQYPDGPEAVPGLRLRREHAAAHAHLRATCAHPTCPSPPPLLAASHACCCCSCCCHLRHARSTPPPLTHTLSLSLWLFRSRLPVA